MTFQFWKETATSQILNRPSITGRLSNRCLEGQRSQRSLLAHQSKRPTNERDHCDMLFNLTPCDSIDLHQFDVDTVKRNA